MGMYVHGKQPTAEVGDHFCNNVWCWHPLWDYVLKVAPWVADLVEYGHSNDGDGLDAEYSACLAEILTQELSAGRTARYEAEYMAAIAALPNETCWLCNGTGVRADKFVQGTCNGCRGKGTERPFATHYPFSAENVAEFRDFLAACGGFMIV